MPFVNYTMFQKKVHKSHSLEFTFIEFLLLEIMISVLYRIMDEPITWRNTTIHHDATCGQMYRRFERHSHPRLKSFPNRSVLRINPTFEL